jgi:hypothetical protein
MIRINDLDIKAQKNGYSVNHSCLYHRKKIDFTASNEEIYR